jgi:hypothetical protein
MPRRPAHSPLASPLASALALVAVVAAPRVAVASPLIETVGSVGGNAGEQGVVAGPGAASTYFNPALLIDADSELLLAYVLVSEQVGITLQGRPPGSDVPLAAGNRGSILVPNQSGSGLVPLPNSVVPTQWLQQGCAQATGQAQCTFAARPRQAQGSSGQTRSYLTIGLVKNLVRDRFTLGLYAMLPVSSFTTAQAFYADEREALFSNSLHPELYGDRLTAVSVVAGAAFKLLPGLSIGASVSLGLANAASSQDYVQDATNYNTLLLDNHVSTTVNVSPTVGVKWDPTPWLRIGGAIHSPESFTVNTTLDASLPSGTESGTTQPNVFDWMPWSVGLGAQAEIVRRGAYVMSLVGSLQYSLWSAYQDRQGNSPSMYGPSLAWSDVASGALGTRVSYKNARGYLDLRYVPSPVPEQTGRSNYVDNDRFGVGLGGDVLLHLPAVVRPGIQLFADRLVPRNNEKNPSQLVDELPDGAVYATSLAPVPGSKGLQTNNPGWPGFSSQGWIWGAMVTISIPL